MRSRSLSLPVRERGSKLATIGTDCTLATVAPRAGAWIETYAALQPVSSSSGRSPCGSVDRNYTQMQDGVIHAVAPRAGAWIETDRMTAAPACAAGRSPCGSVDRN